MKTVAIENQISIGGIQYAISRPHDFGLAIERPIDVSNEDYLHDLLLARDCREEFLSLIEAEGLIVCRNVKTDASTYRRVRGKSSGAKLSQAEYYHHDGCSCPTKPRVVEIRFPHQDISREIATAIAPFPKVIRAMLMALPEEFLKDESISDYAAFANRDTELPAVETWDQIQGKVTRLVRREMDAESCRAFFRRVDELAGAYVFPWEMGESRLMLNSHDDLTRTMQHRRSYQGPRKALEQNGSLVKRWTAEEA